jgi:hypothetical protein
VTWLFAVLSPRTLFVSLDKIVGEAKNIKVAMNPYKSASLRVLRNVCLVGLLALTNLTVFGQLPNDSSLRLWLKADSATGSTNDQTTPGVLAVPEWTSSDSYQTILALPPLDCNYDFNDQSNHTPQLIMFTNNGVAFPALEFRQANDPQAVPNHLADRLWQTNNLLTNDPCDIDVTNDMTIFVVYRNVAPGGVGPYNCIVAMRSSATCPFDLSYNAANQNYCYITYAGTVVYALGNPIPILPDGSLGWGIVEMNLTAGGTLTFRDYYPSTLGWQTYSETNVPRNEFNAGDPLTVCCHTQGATPPCDVLGSGADERFAGDLAEIVIYARSLTSNEQQNAESYLLAKYFLQAGPPQISVQPQTQTIDALGSASFTVLPDGTPPFTYQWLRNGTPIQGANAATFSLSNAVTANSGTYTVIVSNSISFIDSSNAVLEVISPTNPPTALSALLDYTNNGTVVVTLSELVTEQTAANAANYTIDDGVSVLSVNVVTNTSETNYTTTVILTTSPITEESTLTIKGLTDQFGNTQTNSQATILVPGAPTTAPTSNLILWLAADLGDQYDANGVFEWDDQSGYPTEHDAFPSFGNVPLGQIAFPNGMHPALNFNGAAGMQCDNTADLNLEGAFTIYLVGDVDASKLSDDFIGNWTGYVLGGSDSTEGALKWSTWGLTTNGADVYEVIDPSPVLGNRVPTLIEATYENPGNQTLLFNGTQVDLLTNTLPIDYSGARGFSIGALFPTTTQDLVGDIEEILIYTSVSSSQDAAVQKYLTTKYFSPTLTPPALVSATRGAQVQTSVTVVFSLPVGPSATNAANYTINNGATVSAATLVNPTNVVLTTSALAAGQHYTLTVNGLSDWAGNNVAANSQATIVIPNFHLDIALQSGQINLTWTNATATLQSARAISGPWSTVSGATSPYVVAPSGTALFFQLTQ